MNASKNSHVENEQQSSSSSSPSSPSLPTQKYNHKLIDVDCNLIHTDLTSLLQSSTSLSYYEKSKSNHLNILYHPSTSLSNIRGMFSPSSTIDEAEKFHNVLLGSDIDSRNHIDIRMSVGIHPYHTSESELGVFSIDGDSDDGTSNVDDVQFIITGRIERLLDNDRENGYITCIGETGLDYSDGFPDRKEQLPWFEFQLNQAKKYNLPLFLHERLAFDDTLRIIDKVFPNNNEEGCNSSSPKIIIHCFTGNRNELKEYIKRGYYISLSGYILKAGDGPNEINQCLKDGMIPMDKLMIETDAPYMGFNSCRKSYYDIESIINEEFQLLKSKKRKSLFKSIYPNVPSALPLVFEHVVDCLNEGRKERGEDVLDIDYVASCLYQNSKQFFRFDL